MLNRDYACDIDEDDLDDELGELEKELKAEKAIAKKKEINPQQQNIAWSEMHSLLFKTIGFILISFIKSHKQYR